MILLIDDERLTAPGGITPDVIVRTWKAARALVTDNVLFRFEVVYLDHDLGDSDLSHTGYDWITYLEQRYQFRMAFLPERIVCVSSNPPGRARINQVIEKLYPTAVKAGKDA